MSKIKLNINDEVKLWNGEEGTISELIPSKMYVVITKENSFPTECHKMNIRYLNGEEVDAGDLTM